MMMKNPPLAKTLMIDREADLFKTRGEAMDSGDPRQSCLFSVSSVQDAIHSLQSDTFDLVVMDEALLGDSDFQLLKNRMNGHPFLISKESPGEEDEEVKISLELLSSDSARRRKFDSPLIQLTCLFLESYLQNKKQMAKQTEALKRLIEDHVDGILVVDKQGRVLHSNPAAELIFNTKQNELEGRLIGVPYSRDELVQVEIYRKDLGPATIELKSHRTDWFGEHAHLLVLHDVTERKTEEARRLVAEMKSKDVQRMNSLGFLAGGIVHDFNNILGGIMPLMELAQEEVSEGTLKGFLNQSFAGLQRMSHLVKQLQDLTGKRPSDIVLTDVKEIVGEIHDLLKPVVPKNIQLDFQTTDQTLVTLGDSAGIYQSILNICFNAMDAMPEGGKLTVHASLRDVTEKLRKFHPQYEKCEELVAVSIWDTGIGMNEETQRHIFDPFYSTKPMDSKKGRGLGLAIAWKQVKEHGGHIDVSSQLGVGTEFVVYLPSGRNVQAVLNAKKMCEVTGEKKRRWCRDPREMMKKLDGVLIIDDEDSVGKAFSEMIKFLGYEVTCAQSGEQGIEFFRNQKNNIQVVLLDISMPGMGGEETFEKLREIDPKVKVLFITGHNVATCEENLVNHGAAGAIQKPVRIEELANKLESVLTPEVAR
ncbi:MAG: response regulator [Candidatus Omnitrophica bacterium]|nr:response regulator [Candidatus Omnitrophota bacterium]